MSCDYMWYNLANKIQKQVVEPLKGVLSTDQYNKINKPTWFNLPKQSLIIFDVLVSKYVEITGEEYSIQRPIFIWYALPDRINVLCNLVIEIEQAVNNNLEITGTLPKEFSCVEGTDEIFIYGSGFTNTVNVLVDDRDVIDFEIVSNTVLKIIPVVVVPYPATDTPIEIKVITSTDISNTFYLNVTNDFEVDPIILTQDSVVISDEANAELSICSSFTGLNVTCITAQGTFKALNNVVDIDGSGNISILKSGTEYIYYDVTGSPECGRQYLRLNVVPDVVITAQPTNKSRITGRTFTISIHTENALSHQWQVSTDDGITFTDLTNSGIYSGVTTQVLTLTNATTSESGYVYQCVVTGNLPCSDTISNGVITTIGEEVGIVSEPSVIELCEGMDAIFVVETEGTVVSYQWYEDQGFGMSPISDDATYSGTDTNTLTVNNITSAMSGWAYSLEIRGATEIIQTNTAPLITVC